MLRLTLPSLCAMFLFGLTALNPGVAAAVTGSVCLRNDGVGTFSGLDLALFANSDWNAGDRTGSGPNTNLAPGQGTCVAMTGLYAWNGSQYAYQFEITFMDSTGNVTFTSPSGIQLTNSGSWYIGANGGSQSQPSLANYIGITNQAPPAYGSMSAYPNPGAESSACYVYWTGLTSAQVQDWDHNELKRGPSASGPWTVAYSQYSWGFQNRTDAGLVGGTTYHYRIDTVDEYGALTAGPLTSCTTTTPPPADADGDGFAADVDCDDVDPSVFPGALEDCANGIDDDCDGGVDGADLDCASGDDDDDDDDDSTPVDDDDSTADDDDSAPDDDDSTDDDDSAPDDDDSTTDDDDSTTDDDDSTTDDDDDSTTDDDDDSTTDDDDDTAGPDLFEGDDAGECRDGADNDQDGDFDCDDSDCAGSSDCAPPSGGGCGQGRASGRSADAGPLRGGGSFAMLALLVVGVRRRRHTRLP